MGKSFQSYSAISTGYFPRKTCWITLLSLKDFPACFLFYPVLRCSVVNLTHLMRWLCRKNIAQKLFLEKTRFFLFFNPFTFILFFQSCSTRSQNMPHNIFDVFKVQQQEEWGSKRRAHAAQQPTADSVGNAPCAPQRRDGGATRQRAVPVVVRRDGARCRWRRWRRQPAPYNADVSTASNSGSLAQMSVALHRKASAHCTTLRRDPLTC